MCGYDVEEAGVAGGVSLGGVGACGTEEGCGDSGRGRRGKGGAGKEREDEDGDG